MGTTGDSHEATPFATAQEVGGIRRTLDNFMKTQEEHNKTLQNTMDQVMGYLSQVTGHSGSSPMEGKGSNFAGKAVTTPHPHTSSVWQAVLHPTSS